MSTKEIIVKQRGGVSILGLLGLVFVVLKIVEVKPIADWSWWWVTCPFWIPIAIVISVLLIMAVIFIAAAIISVSSK